MTIIQNPIIVDEELYKSILHLLPQLNTRHPLPTYAHINSLLKSNSSLLFVARYPIINSPISGMLTLVIFQLPSGIRAHIEDVVVDIELRNKGIALALMKTALQSAQKAGAKGVTLTSHSSRLSAIGLYESLGFKKWDTNMFYYQFDQPITF
jgi:ribosomal protein S18 acetylase RimI-like enzyme